jgi:septum formation protein
MGLNPLVQPADIDESELEGESPADMVKRLALAKSQAVAPQYPDALVLGSDTIVVLDDTVLGKPATSADAANMLRRLSGRTHRVMTSIALVHASSGRSTVDIEVTEVTFDDLTDPQIDRYVEGGSPMDKAGAYGIQDDQGAFFVRRIDGDYYTVMGLPLNRLSRVARTHFPDLVSD